ncbi:hypothetical protein LIER_27216 [Lithospermum erythrorhizon]|uniref:Reverse transcriptase n=1 Tax=Lithospermum erythrorhizon TaxID=34254 RepID=A0AAV3RE98_LITER
MISMLRPIPFYQRGVDIVVDLPGTPGGKRLFMVRDLVIRARQTSAHGKQGKLESSWEVPYHVRRITGPVTYELETLEGRQVPRSWNASQLRKYYV